MAVASAILMIRPAAFGFNEQTARDNFFQQRTELSCLDIHRLALSEFDNMVNTLREKDITVKVVEDTPTPVKPDAVFVNNWLVTSPEGKVFVFPMYAANRRPEKRKEILDWLKTEYQVAEVQDWSHYEAEGRFLEGTGSLVIDHDQKIIYAGVSQRTSPVMVEKFATANGYHAFLFLATDEAGRPVYHTNVVMMRGTGYCILCTEAIEEEWDLIALRQLLESTGHEIIPVTRAQMHAFAANLIEVKNTGGDHFILLSQSAWKVLEEHQKARLEKYAPLLPIPVDTIEKAGGGSVRCMIAEIFLQPKNS